MNNESLEHLLHPTNSRYFKQLGPGRPVRASRPRRCIVNMGAIRRARSLARADVHDTRSGLYTYTVTDGTP
jgi:hypothetical protein